MVERGKKRSSLARKAVILSLLCVCSGSLAWESQYWQEFQKQGPTGKALPDFSYAGYGMGDSPIPNLPQVAVATDFGAVPNDEGDDTEALQKAVDAVAAKGGGALFIPAGRYYINSKQDGKNPNKCLRIKASNVVLRGAGSGPEGTILHLRAPIRSIHSDATVVLGKSDWGGGSAIVTQDAKRGDTLLTVNTTTPLGKGSRFILTATDPLIDEKAPKAEKCEIPTCLVAPYQLRDDLYDTVGRRGKKLDFPVRIAEIVDDHTVRLAQPLRVDLLARWTPSISQWRHSTGSGIEGIRFASDWPGGYAHHKPFPIDAKGKDILRSSSEQNYQWNAILISRLWDGWVRDVVIQDYTQGITANWSKNLTFRRVAVVGVTGHTALTLSHAHDCLTEGFTITSQRVHTFFVSGMASGNVFRNSVVDYPHDKVAGTSPALDFHGLFPYENLYENIGQVYVMPGGAPSYLPHAGVRNVFWNLRCPAEMSRGATWPLGGPDEFFRTYAKTTSNAPRSAHEHWPKSFLVGLTREGDQPVKVRDSAADRDDEWLRVEGLNRPGVQPPSLYEAQFELRRGKGGK